LDRLTSTEDAEGAGDCNQKIHLRDAENAEERQDYFKRTKA
jgi:hypothetical protein